MSNNPLYDEGAQRVFKGLMEGVVISEAMYKKDPSIGPMYSKITPPMKYLSMRNVDMGDASASVIIELLQENKRIEKIIIEGNTINYKHVEEIAAGCLRNRQQKKEKMIPKYA